MKGNLKRPDFRELMNPLLRTTAGILFFSWFFYRSVFAVILFIFPGILYFRKCVREQREKKRWELTVQFKECLLAVANSLRTGYAVENAFLESREDIRLLFGEETEINCQGPHIDEEELLNLFDKIDNIQSGDTLIVAGNIPNTLPDDVYERIIERLDGKDVRIVVDATKKLLVNSLKYKPFLIKPNRQELSEIFDTTVKTESDVVKYAQELQKMGAKNVLVSLGGDGALLVDEFGKVHKEGVIKGHKVLNTVGSGDSMVAGFVAGCIDKNDYAYALKLGSACGNATAFLNGLATKDKIDELLAQF